MIWQYRIYYRIPEFFGNELLSVRMEFNHSLSSVQHLYNAKNVIADATCEHGCLPDCEIVRVSLLGRREGRLRGFCSFVDDPKQPREASLSAEAFERHCRRYKTDASYRAAWNRKLKAEAVK